MRAWFALACWPVFLQAFSLRPIINPACMIPGGGPEQVAVSEHAGHAAAAPMGAPVEDHDHGEVPPELIEVCLCKFAGHTAPRITFQAPILETHTWLERPAPETVAPRQVAYFLPFSQAPPQSA